MGPLVAIDGAPENTRFALARWRLQYWAEFFSNVLIRARYPTLVDHGPTMPSIAMSISKNLAAVGKTMLGMNRAQSFGGGYAVKHIVDVSRYSLVQASFMNRLFNAIFEYNANAYLGEVVVYEAAMKPALLLPQIGRIWQNLAPRAEVVSIFGTHYHMMRKPYADALGKDLLARIAYDAKKQHGELVTAIEPLIPWGTAALNRDSSLS